MDSSNYFRFLHHAMKLYNDGKLAEAYELVRREGDSVGGNKALIMNFEYCLASRLGDVDAALRTFREAVESHGYWYGYNYLLSDEDLASIRGTEEFKRLAEICKGREDSARKETGPELILRSKHGGTGKAPILMALHGNGDGVSLTGDYWIPAMDEGYVVALPQSSQMTQIDCYTWQDLEKGRTELRAHLADLAGRQGLSLEGLVIAGFSGGARLALYSILTGDVSPRGFILMAPYLPNLDEWKGMIDQRPAKGARGHILCGDRDDQCLEGAKMAAALLTDAGIPTEFHILEGLDHEFPDDFHSRLASMLDSFK